MKKNIIVFITVAVISIFSAASVSASCSEIITRNPLQPYSGKFQKKLIDTYLRSYKTNWNLEVQNQTSIPIQVMLMPRNFGWLYTKSNGVTEAHSTSQEFVFGTGLSEVTYVVAYDACRNVLGKQKVSFRNGGKTKNTFIVKATKGIRESLYYNLLKETNRRLKSPVDEFRFSTLDEAKEFADFMHGRMLFKAFVEAGVISEDSSAGVKKTLTTRLGGHKVALTTTIFDLTAKSVEQYSVSPSLGAEKFTITAGGVKTNVHFSLLKSGFRRDWSGDFFTVRTPWNAEVDFRPVK